MINISARSSSPLYEQVRDELRRLMVAGVLRPGEQIYTVRELAAALSINPNTIQRAYRELEQEGYIYSVPGKGSFIAQQDDVAAERRDKLLGRFDQTARELMFLGQSVELLSARLLDISGALQQQGGKA